MLLFVGKRQLLACSASLLVSPIFSHGSVRGKENAPFLQQSGKKNNLPPLPTGQGHWPLEGERLAPASYSKGCFQGRASTTWALGSAAPFFAILSTPSNHLAVFSSCAFLLPCIAAFPLSCFKPDFQWVCVVLAVRQLLDMASARGVSGPAANLELALHCLHQARGSLPVRSGSLGAQKSGQGIPKAWALG